MKLFVCLLALVAVAACGEIQLPNGMRRRDIRIPLPFGEHIQQEPRIVGGQEVEANSLPHKVALFISTAQGTFFCGGSIISANTILTAAHCVDIATQVQVVAGAHRPFENEPTQQVAFSSSITIHTAWNPATITNDIALIHLPTPLQLNAFVSPVSLPTRSQIGNAFTGQPSVASGWGLESDSATSVSDVLRYVIVDIIANLVCNIFFLGAIQGTHICTSGSGGQGPCSGDSGGSLQIIQTNQTVGIVSFGIALGCEVGFPTAYTRLTSFLDWIEINSDVTIS